MKICGRCKAGKNYEHFYKNKRKKDGLQNYCKDCTKKSNRDSFQKHKRQRMRKSSEWQRSERGKKYRRDLSRKKYKNNPVYNLQCRLRSRLRDCLFRQTMTESTSNLLGCTWDHLKVHIEKQFHAGMTWENMGEWHVDHIIPCSAFKDDLQETQKIAFWYQNLQPLWARKNLVKNGTYRESDKNELIRKYISAFTEGAAPDAKWPLFVC